jgi:hypothetical protein
MVQRDPIYPTLEPGLTEIEREQNKQRFQNQFMLGMLRGSGVPSEEQEDVRGVLPPGIVGSLDQPPPGPISKIVSPVLVPILNKLRQFNMPTDAMTEAIGSHGGWLASAVAGTATGKVPLPPDTIPKLYKNFRDPDPVSQSSRRIVSDVLAGNMSIPDAAGALRDNFETRPLALQMLSPSPLDVPIPVAFAVRAGIKLLSTAGLNRRLLNEIVQAASKPQLGVIPEGTTSRFIDDAGDPIQAGEGMFRHRNLLPPHGLVMPLDHNALKSY